VSTYRELMQHAKEQLAPMVLSMADLEAKELAYKAVDLSGVHFARDQFLGRLDRFAPAVADEILDDLLARRLSGEPLAYILGEWDFYGLTLTVTPDVLIPRADTETVVEHALELLNESDLIAPGENAKILDLCCGSGCIGIAMLTEYPRSIGLFADISKPALKVAAQNIKDQELSARAVVMEMDALDLPPEGMHGLDMIVSNPPYITSDEMAYLDVSVSGFEPELALYGGSDGLNFYRSITVNYSKILKPGGFLVFETGYEQAYDVKKIMEANGFYDIQTVRDLADNERVVSGRYRGTGKEEK